MRGSLILSALLPLFENGATQPCYMQVFDRPGAVEYARRDLADRVEADFTDAASVNAVPDTATMSLSCRYVDPKDYDRILALIRETTGLEVVGADPRKHRPPVVTDENDPEVQAFFRVLKAKWPDFRLGRMNAATDASRYAHLALPTVIYGAVSHGAHAEDEWVSLSDLGAWPDVLTEYLKCR